MKILVVEDNPISRKLTRLALEMEGFSVFEAADGQSAIDHVARDRPDLILQDILLPDMDGFEIVKRLHELPGADKIPILALTGLISAGDEMGRKGKKRSPKDLRVGGGLSGGG